MRIGATVLLTGLALLSTSGGVAAIAAAPTAITGPVASVGATSATATGTVNPGGQATSWYFEYGTSTGYGKKTATKSAGSGGGNAQVSGALTGLASGTTYHYRLVAANAAGTRRGADGIFTTLAAPVVVTGSARSVTATAATLTGTVDPNGRPTTWYVDYGASTSYGSRTALRSAGSGTTAKSVSTRVSKLAAGRLYHYRVVATSDAGTTRGADGTFSTTGAPLVRTGAAREVGPTAARLTGSVNPQGRRTTWYFEYGTTTRYGSRTPKSPAGSAFGEQAVTAPILGLQPTALYHYRLVATNDKGTTRGADLTLTTTGVTLAARAPWVVYGRAVLLSGLVPARRPGESVTVFAAKFGARSPVAVATAVTGDGGVWRYLARPAIRTTYLASSNGVTSREMVIGVRPRVLFARVGRARFGVRVLGTRSFRGRRVKLQRLTSVGWRTVKTVRLSRRSAKTFRVQLRKGRSTLRVVMSVNQAGPGYLSGISRTIVYRR
jgi:hypothetical protein